MAKKKTETWHKFVTCTTRMKSFWPFRTVNCTVGAFCCTLEQKKISEIIRRQENPNSAFKKSEIGPTGKQRGMRQSGRMMRGYLRSHWPSGSLWNMATVPSARAASTRPFTCLKHLGEHFKSALIFPYPWLSMMFLRFYLFSLLLLLSCISGNYLFI